MIKIGFARVDVTPPLGTLVCGYYEERVSKGVLDPIELNAIAFGNETDTAILITADFTGMTMARITPVRARIAEATGVPADRILITSLHQHTTIYVGDEIGDAEDFAIVRDEDYLNLLYRKFCDVAKMAVDDMAPARVFGAEKQALEPLAFTRRYVMADGVVRTNPDTRKHGTPVRHAEPSDNAVRLLRFVREGARDVVLVNFSTHPDVVGGEHFCADWPGFVRRFVEEDHPDTLCISTVGCQGDSNHLNFFKEPKDRIVGGKGITHAAHMGRVIADTVKQLLTGELTEHTGEDVFGGVRLIYNRTNTSGIEYFDEAERFIADYKAGLHCPTEHVTDISYAMRVQRLLTAPIYRAVPVTLLRLGDVCFVGFGGEPFTNYGTAAREIAGDKTVICTCCANGYEGYLPTAKAFAEGGYEINTSLFTAELQQQCIGALAEMLEN